MKQLRIADGLGGHPTRRPAIIGLLFGRGPTAISFRVRAIVVPTIKRVLQRRSVTHVTVESLEAVAPFGANYDASRAVLFKVRGLWIVTAILHAFPRRILYSLGHSMGAVGGRCAFTIEAATRKRLLAQVVLSNRRFCSAVAETGPCAMFGVWPFRFTQNKQPSKEPTRQVWSLFHGHYYTGEMSTCGGYVR